MISNGQKNGHSIIDKISKLRSRTEARGASGPESDAAALQIGRLLMKNPDLQVSAGPASSQARPQSSPWENPGWRAGASQRPAAITIVDVRVVAQTPKAVLYALPGWRNQWIPRSVHSVAEPGRIVVDAWFIQKEMAGYRPMGGAA